MALYESHLYIECLKPVLSGSAVWINPFESRRLSDSKMYQLELAVAAGFEIPDTLMSNRIDDVRVFVRQHAGKVVYKTFHQAGWHDKARDIDFRTFTTPVTEADLFDEVSVTACPGIYQSHVPKRAELRVTFFGETYYAVRIFSQSSSMGKVDWRSDVAREAKTEPTTLHPRVLERCKEFASKMGLLHGSIDLIETEAGETVFLEVNEMGQFLWLEDFHPEMPILATAAAFSLDPRRDFTVAMGSLPTVSMSGYRKSKAFTEWLQTWDAYVAAGIYPQTYME